MSQFLIQQIRNPSNELTRPLNRQIKISVVARSKELIENKCSSIITLKYHNVFRLNCINCPKIYGR